MTPDVSATPMPNGRAAGYGPGMDAAADLARPDRGGHRRGQRHRPGLRGPAGRGRRPVSWSSTGTPRPAKEVADRDRRRGGRGSTCPTWTRSTGSTSAVDIAGQQRRPAARRAGAGVPAGALLADPAGDAGGAVPAGCGGACPHMYAQGWGRVVNISSVHGLRASPYKSAYVAAKHGLEGLSKVIALEGAEHGVTSNCVNPAYVRTPLVERQIAAQATAHGLSADEVVAAGHAGAGRDQAADRAGRGGRGWSPTCARRPPRSSPAPRSCSTAAGPPADSEGARMSVARVDGTADGTKMADMGAAVFLELLAREAAAVEFERPLVEARAAGRRRTRSTSWSGPSATRCRCGPPLERRRRREARAVALFDTAGDLAALRDLDAVLQAIVRRARTLLGTDVAYLTLNDAGRRRHLHAGHRRLACRPASSGCGCRWAPGWAGWWRRPRTPYVDAPTTRRTPGSSTPREIDAGGRRGGARSPSSASRCGSARP